MDSNTDEDLDHELMSAINLLAIGILGFKFWRCVKVCWGCQCCRFLFGLELALKLIYFF